MLVQIVLLDGFDPLDVVAPHEDLGASGLVAGRGTVRSARGTVRSARGTVPVLEGLPT
jgi:hypothetical protein